jgi:hypothetical protein
VIYQIFKEDSDTLENEISENEKYTFKLKIFATFSKEKKLCNVQKGFFFIRNFGSISMQFRPGQFLGFLG